MKTLHVISHTHWDREWYETFQQFRLKLVHLVDKLLGILDEDPDFKHFMLDGQTIVLDDYLHMRPEMESVLRQHIQNGRILIGPWHILPDMFLVSPEAHIRNLLEGDRTARKFGSKMPIGYIPDPFGHPGQVPQILKGFGLEAAALWRGLSDQPPELLWESPDGTGILLAYLRDSYSNGASLPVANVEAFAKQIAIAGDSLAQHSNVDDYLIMLGTDHMEPSPYTSAAIAFANNTLDGTAVVHSTLPDYVRQINAQIEAMDHPIPTVRGELRACDRMHLLPGVLSTRMWIKQRNHASQILLEKWAEPFSVFAERFLSDERAQVPWRDKTAAEIASNRVRNVAPIIRQAWRLVMENHPHDSICGCSIDQVHDEMKPRFDQADQIGEEITLQALQAISRSVDTQLDRTLSSIVIYNPLGTARHDLVEVALTIPEDIAAFELIDADGNVLAHEFLGASNEELANILLSKSSLRDTIGAINEGHVAGMAITHVKVTREGAIATIDAILESDGVPNVAEWHQAEAMIAKFEADAGVTHFRVLARSPQASTIRFVSPEIPALGWGTVWVRAVQAPPVSPPAEVSPWLKPFIPMVLRFSRTSFGEKLLARLAPGDEQKPPFIIENAHFHVEANPENGTLTVTDKDTHTTYAGLNRFVDGGDAGDEYNYSPPIGDAFFTPVVRSIKVFNARLIPSIEISYELKVPEKVSEDRKGRSKHMVTLPIRSRISLIPGARRVDIHTEIENHAKDHRLRAHFPAPFKVREADYDGHFEVVRRPVGVPEMGEDWVEAPRPEVPQRAFTDISNGEVGLMIANRGLPEVEVINGDNSEIALTLIRSVGWLSRDDMVARKGHAGPGFETPGGQVPGKWNYDYAILPHQGNWHEVYQKAYAFESPLRATETGVHGGTLPNQGSFITHSPAEFVISAIKETADGTGWLVRGYNISSEPIELDLKPLRQFTRAEEVNLAEETIRVLDIDADGSISLAVSGHKVVSIKFSG